MQVARPLLSSPLNNARVNSTNAQAPKQSARSGNTVTIQQLEQPAESLLGKLSRKVEKFFQPVFEVKKSEPKTEADVKAKDAADAQRIANAKAAAAEEAAEKAANRAGKAVD